MYFAKLKKKVVAVALVAAVLGGVFYAAAGSIRGTKGGVVTIECQGSTGQCPCPGC